jgi:hypothetical protein
MGIVGEEVSCAMGMLPPLWIEMTLVKGGRVNGLNIHLNTSPLLPLSKNLAHNGRRKPQCHGKAGNEGLDRFSLALVDFSEYINFEFRQGVAIR